MFDAVDTLRVLRETILNEPSLQARDHIQKSIIPRFVHHRSCWSQGVLVSDGLSTALGGDILTILKNVNAYSGPAMSDMYRHATQNVRFENVHHMEAVFHYSPVPGLFWHVTGIPIPDVPAMCWEGIVKPTTVEPYVKIITNKQMEGRRMCDLIEGDAMGAVQ